MKKKLLLISILFLTLSNVLRAQLQCSAGMQFFVTGMQVQFFDSSYVSSGTVTSWSWSFPGGTPATSTQQNPVVVYSANGTYQACLTITTSLGCIDSVCQNVVITNCTLSAAIGFANPTLTVNAMGGTPPYTYLWSTGANTQSINVTTIGTYCVTVYDVNSCSVTTCYQYTGGGGCNAYFSTNTVGNNVQFMNASSGNYASWLWVFGDSTTSTAWSPTHTYPNGVWTPCLYLYDSIGNILCQYCTVVTVPGGGANNDTICGQVFVDTNGNGIMDSTEVGFGGGYVYFYGSSGNYSATIDSLGHYVGYVPDGTYSIWYCSGLIVTFTIPPDDTSGCAFYDSVTVSGGGLFCGYNFGFQYNSAIIEGCVFIDTNNNGVKDAGEPGAPYQPVQVGPYSVYTNSNGNYSVSVAPGTYTVSYSPSGPYSGYTLTTSGSITVVASTIGNTYGNNNFGIYIVPGSVNLSVNITPHTTVTPGFPAWYDIQVCNIGANATGATLTMFHDPGLTFDYSSPVQSSYNATAQTLTWNIANINPGSCAYYWVHFDALASLIIGSSTFELVNVVPTIGVDIDMSNNTDSVHQIVTGSWDPNNKLSVSTNYIDPNYQVISSVNPDQTIEYSINFQNLGTAPAVNISVLDNLETQLDGNSFQLLNTSHNAQVTRLGNQLTFLFANIMLPDANSNLAGSMGFINFRVNSQNGLPSGTIISDDAAIYFDFNSAVVTNPAVVELIDPTGIEENNLSSSIFAYPNPTDEQLKVQSSKFKVERIEISNLLGESVLVQYPIQNQNEFVVNVKHLQAGLYILKLQGNGNYESLKLMVK